MDWFPLYNALRIAAISTAAVFFLGIWAAYYIAKLPRLVKGVLDVVLTLPLVLPPTVVGWLLLMLLGPKRPLGAWVLEAFGVKLVMTWWVRHLRYHRGGLSPHVPYRPGGLRELRSESGGRRTDVGTIQQLGILAGTDAGMQAGHPCRHRACDLPGLWRIRQPPP